MLGLEDIRSFNPKALTSKLLTKNKVSCLWSLINTSFKATLPEKVRLALRIEMFVENCWLKRLVIFEATKV